MIIRSSFGAKKKNFATSVVELQSKVDYLAQIQKRLERVIIENRDFEQLIKTYDRDGALFYADPPYYGAEHYYNSEFGQAEHERLREVLGNIKGKFVL